MPGLLNEFAGVGVLLGGIVEVKGFDLEVRSKGIGIFY
jgi:hypothetical protein